MWDSSTLCSFNVVYKFFVIEVWDSFPFDDIPLCFPLLRDRRRALQGSGLALTSEVLKPETTTVVASLPAAVSSSRAGNIIQYTEKYTTARGSHCNCRYSYADLFVCIEVEFDQLRIGDRVRRDRLEDPV